VLVMKGLVSILPAAVLCLAAIAPAGAVDLRTEINDPSAGPVPMRTGACFTAVRFQKGPPCPEPQVVTSGDNASRIANRLDRATWLIAQQKYDKAREETDVAVGIDETNVSARFLRARLSMTLFEWPAAERDLLILRKQAPNDVDIRATAAHLLLANPSQLEALREFHRIVSEHPDHLFSREQRARLLLERKQADAALNDLNFILEAQPNYQFAHKLRAQAMQMAGRNLPAVADIKAGQKDEPDNALSLAQRAEAYAKAGNDELALKDYDRVLTILEGGSPLYVMPGNMRSELLVKRAHVLVNLRQLDRAADDAVMAAKVGGVQAALRAQIKLRRSGFSEVPLDGKLSPELRKGLIACFGQKVCFQGVMKAI
jgi:tetratricopeptide (TPR) repeat protein